MRGSPSPAVISDAQPPWGVSTYLAGEEVSFLRYLAERSKGLAPPFAFYA